MDSIRNKFGSMSKKMVAVIATVLLSLTCGVGIVLAAAGGGGGDIGGGDLAGTNFYYYAKWDDVPVYDESAGEWVPKQGWESDSVDYFWRGINNEMDGWVGLRFDSGTTASYQRKIFDEACYEALARCKTRDNQKARIVAVSVFFSNSNAQGGNVALMAQYNENRYTNFFEEPKDTYVDGDHGVLTNTYGNVFDLEHEWWEDCDQVGALPGEKWMHYIWRITGEDTCGGVNGKAPYSVIAIAINEDMMGGQNVTLVKKVVGEDAEPGSPARLLYESTLNNDCYDLTGTTFRLYQEDGVTPVSCTVLDENEKPTGEKINVEFTTDANGETNAIYRWRNGTYWLREVKAPKSGFYVDTDGDGIRDELDKSQGLGKKVVIKGKTITIDGVELKPERKLSNNQDLYVIHWMDEPMNDPQPIYLQKRDSLTGGVTQMPEGEGDTNGAKYRFAYFKGIYTQVEQLPGYDKTTGKVDWNYADATALWQTRTYTDATGTRWSGYISFDLDDPIEGEWKYKTSFQNYCPLGTLAIVEDTPPKGYLIDNRIYLYSIADDGTHTLANINHTPWNKDGSDGSTNRDWNNFANDYELNGDRDDVVTPWE